MQLSRLQGLEQELERERVKFVLTLVLTSGLCYSLVIGLFVAIFTLTTVRHWTMVALVGALLAGVPWSIFQATVRRMARMEKLEAERHEEEQNTPHWPGKIPPEVRIADTTTPRHGLRVLPSKTGSDD